MWIGSCAVHAQGDYAALADNPDLIPAPMQPVVTTVQASQPMPILKPMQMTVVLGEQGEIVGMVSADLLAYTTKNGRTERQRKRDAIRERRRNMGTGEVIGDHLANNWGKYLGLVAGAVAVDRVADSQGWLWHKKSTTGKTAQGDLIGDDTSTAIANQITGNGNVINQTIILQQGGQSGAANTGTQMPPVE
jgi:hypothetical protein